MPSSEPLPHGSPPAPIPSKLSAAPIAAPATTPPGPQKSLVIVQATLSVVLLTGAGLLTRSLTNLQHQDFGYDIDHRVVLGLIAPWPSYSKPQLDAMYRELQDRLSHIPGVERAALAQYTPLTDNWGEMVIRQGHGMPSMNDPVGSSWDHVAPGYLETLGQHIIRGRSISADDTAATQNIVVVERSLRQALLQTRRKPHRPVLRPRSPPLQQHL